MVVDDPSIEPSSLEYIEDSYLPKLDHNLTPSLDDITEYDYRFMKCDDNDDELDDVYDENGAVHWSEEADRYLRSLSLDQILTLPDDCDQTEMQTVETEFGDSLHQNSLPVNSTLSPNRLKNYLIRTNKLRFLTKKRMRDVRVTFVDFSKPYLAKISSGDNYKKFLNIGDNSGKLKCKLKYFVISCFFKHILHFEHLKLLMDPIKNNSITSIKSLKFKK